MRSASRSARLPATAPADGARRRASLDGPPAVAVVFRPSNRLVGRSSSADLRSCRSRGGRVAEFPNWMISVDDHVLEPGHLWQDRVPAKLRDRAPRLIDTDEGTVWEFDGQR